MHGTVTPPHMSALRRVIGGAFFGALVSMPIAILAAIRCGDEICERIETWHVFLWGAAFGIAFGAGVLFGEREELKRWTRNWQGRLIAARKKCPRKAFGETTSIQRSRRQIAVVEVCVSHSRVVVFRA
jgi:hypothetical protein